MKILSINYLNNQQQFKARTSKKFLTDIAKKADDLQIIELTNYKPNKSLFLGNVQMDPIKCLELNGFTKCLRNGDVISLESGYNGGCYSINSPANNINLLTYIVGLLLHDSSSFGGLLNYRNCVNNLKRQDIIQKGLGINTFLMDTSIDKKYKIIATRDLLKHTKKAITPRELFFIDSEGFYYDASNKTVYSVNINKDNRLGSHPVFRECKFETDDKGNLIGYKTRGWDIYWNDFVEKSYKEQTTPSRDIDPVVNISNTKMFAEAFRFGNNEPNRRIAAIIPEILKHLSESKNVTRPINENLKFVKFANKNDKIVSRFAYYDPTIGRSFIYDIDGNFKYQLEYAKDDFGNIIGCAKF